MTNDGDDLPPLPASDDPFELLGIAEDASVREVRKAYARRIKIYRPDRAPREFQRIHRAFELVTAGLRDEPTLVAPPSPPPSPDRAAEPPSDEQRRTVSTLLEQARTAVARFDVKATRRLIGELLDLRAPLELVFADPDDLEMLLDSSVLTWSRLGDHDPQGRAVIWRQAFERAFDSDPLRACLLLDDDRLRLDAADDPMLALYLLGRLAALAWKAELPTQALLDRYRAALPAHPVVDHVLEGAGLDIIASNAARAAELPKVLEQLPRLFVSARIGSHDGDRDGEEVHASLAIDLRASLAQLEHFINESPDAYLTLADRMTHDLPPHRLRLDELSPTRLAHLSGQLAEAGRRRWTRPVLLRLAAVVVAAITFAVVIPPLAVVFVLLTIAYVLVTEADRYKNDIRMRVARAILEAPVDSHAAARWIALNRKLRGQLGRFDVAIINDAPLHLFSIVACFAAEVGKTDMHLDDVQGC